MALALTISLIAAIVPTVLYVLVFYWADRYEREPLWLLSVAFLWGAIPAIIVSIIGELILGWSWVGAADSMTGAIVEGAIIAPVVEEMAKGVALLLIFLIMRREFDGVLDGLVYGALIGFGFAMTENFFYFVGAYDEGGYKQLTIVIILRAMLFGLNHAFYTGLNGIGLGLARNSRGAVAKWFWGVTGLCAAIAAHSLHNLGASLAATSVSGLGLSLVVALAGIGLVVLAVLLSWQYERNCIRNELADEVGLFISPSEYAQLIGRWRNPLHKRGSLAKTRARRLHLAVELALRKNRVRDADPAESMELLREIAQIRTQLAPPMG
ncbi:MAG: PrsW family intramembrane metalloprotease [Caldilineaceae bacterium]